MKKLICESCQLYNQDTRRCAAGRILPTKKNVCGIYTFIKKDSEPDPDEKKHGGARQGAGRPKKREKEKKQVQAFSLSLSVIEFINNFSKANGLSKSESVESIIKSYI
jgi:Fe-S-cluster containining protein